MQLKDCSKDLDVREAMYFTHLDSFNLLPKEKKKNIVEARVWSGTGLWIEGRGKRVVRTYTCGVFC